MINFPFISSTTIRSFQKTGTDSDAHSTNSERQSFSYLKFFISLVFMWAINYISLPHYRMLSSIAIAESTSAKKESGVNDKSVKSGVTSLNVKKVSDLSPPERGNGKQAPQIYKWVDDQGRTFYASTKQEPKAELAKLPEIKRIKDAPLDHFKEGCKQHGGASCDRGADSDGSVICLDGFRDSPLPFRFACSSARLTLEELNAKGDKQKIFVKNGSNVQARSVAIKVSLSDGSHIFAIGNQTVEPNSLEEFEIPLKDLKLAQGVKLSQKDVQITCANCE